MEYSFVQLSDIHYDPHYSSKGNEYCHSDERSSMEHKRPLDAGKRGARRDNYKYGRPGSECDSPLVLIEKTVAQLHTLDPDIVLWTGDSSRHDRDIKLPRSPLDIIQGIKRVAALVNSAFRVGTVFPTVGNWDTKVQNAPSLEDYQQLFQIWSILWNEKQRDEIQITFLEGGFYSVKYSKDLVIVSLNTIEFYQDNIAGDCSKHNQQLEWLESILEEAEQVGDNVILIGHVPPMNYLGVPLYHSRCYATFTNLIGRFYKQIVSQYYGHVNRDITYLTTKEPDGSIHFVPLTQQSLSNIIFTDYEIIGQMFTGPSVVPYFYPAFRWGEIGRKGNDANGTLSILEHVQYYAPIDSYETVQSGASLKENQTFYKESCTTAALSMISLTPMDWKALSESIQHEIKVSGSSQLAKYYWECSTVHWVESSSGPLNAAPYSSSPNSQFIVHQQYQKETDGFGLNLDIYSHCYLILIVVFVIVKFFFLYNFKKRERDAK